MNIKLALALLAITTSAWSLTPDERVQIGCLHGMEQGFKAYKKGFKKFSEGEKKSLIKACSLDLPSIGKIKNEKEAKSALSDPFGYGCGFGGSVVIRKFEKEKFDLENARNPDRLADILYKLCFSNDP